MSARHAVIVANSVSYGERSKNVPVNVVQTLVTDLATQLEGLGDHSFTTERWVDEPSDEVRKKCREAIKKASNKPNSLLLFYYFGHGVRSASNDLLLYCKDSDWQDEPSMVKLSDIVGFMTAYHLPRAIVMLDCCHSGAASRDLTLFQAYGGNYYFMGAVSAKEKALIDYGDDRPLGAFSKFILAGFTNLGAAVTPTRRVTFSSFFGFASGATKSDSYQKPYSQDGGLADEVFFLQAVEPRILNRVRTLVPQKSLYRKIFALGTYLSIKPFDSVEALYKLIQQKQPREFLTPVKSASDDRSLEYQVVGKDTFARYIQICRRLGIVIDDETVALSPVGKRMFRREGAQFNSSLYELLIKAWKVYGVELTDIVDVIAERLRRSSIPTGNAIWFDMYLSKRLFMPKWLFQEMLDLTGYVGAINLTRERTFFLAAQGEIDVRGEQASLPEVDR